MEPIVVTEENFSDFKEAVRLRLQGPLEIKIYDQYVVWDFIGDIGFKFNGTQGIEAIRDCLMPRILVKVPDASFKVTFWGNSFFVFSKVLWGKATEEAHDAGFNTPHGCGNVPIICLD